MDFNDVHIDDELKTIKPNFDGKISVISLEEFEKEAEKITESFAPRRHAEILNLLLESIPKIDFKMKAGADAIQKKIQNIETQLMNVAENSTTEADIEILNNQLADLEEQMNSFKLKQKHYLVITIEELLEIAKQRNWGICRKHDFIYLYNGAFWQVLDEGELQKFFATAAERMGVERFEARHYVFGEQLLKQFLSVATLPTLERHKETVLVNLKNGTFEITITNQTLRQPRAEDFLTYQLPFDYDPNAKAPMFDTYLERVLPDKEKQLLLAEYIGSLFIPHCVLKLEKTLLLYGSGANGKSVFFEIINALLGDENVCSYSLQNLTDQNGYYRAKLANKLVNYTSEINAKLEATQFKQLVSGEPIEARLPYGEPFTLREYGKLIFNCNELPKMVEHSEAYFRRFLIIHFNVTIPEAEQDKGLSKKIIEAELSGVFNWVLAGLQRVLKQGGFTECADANNQLNDYRRYSDSVHNFLDDGAYTKSDERSMLLKDLYRDYKMYCVENGFAQCNKNTFSKRLENCGYVKTRHSGGIAFYINKNVFLNTT